MRSLRRSTRFTGESRGCAVTQMEARIRPGSVLLVLVLVLGGALLGQERRPPDCKDPVPPVTGGSGPITGGPSRPHIPGDPTPPKSTISKPETGGAKTGKEGHVSVSIGGLLRYSSDDRDKWPNAMSGIDAPSGVAVVPAGSGGGSGPGGDDGGGGPGGPGEEPEDPTWSVSWRKATCSDPPATGPFYENNICVEVPCPGGCGEVQCNCEISLQQMPALKPLGGWSYIQTVQNAGGGHANVMARPEAGYFVHWQHDATSLPAVPNFEVHAVGGNIQQFSEVGEYGGLSYYQLNWELDPHDNKTNYVYVAGKLSRIQYPNGLDKCFNYSPSWVDPNPTSGEWDAADYSGIEVTWEDSTNPSLDLSALTQYMLFERAKDSAGALIYNGPRPFGGDRIFRVYERKVPIVGELLAASETYDLSAASQVRYSVAQLDYDGYSKRVTAMRRLLVDPAGAGISLSDTVVSNEVTNTFTYVESSPGSGFFRIQTECTPLLSGQQDYAYVWDAATPSRIDQVTVTDHAAGTVTTRVFDDYMRVTSETVTPANNAVGRPRAAASEAVAEPVYVQVQYVYGSCSTCASKPTKITYLPSGRVEEFDYNASTGLVEAHRYSSPSGSGLATTAYTWEPLDPGFPYSQHVLKEIVDDSGTTKMAYTVEPRATLSHGKKVKAVTTESPPIMGPSGLQPAVTSSETYDISDPPTGSRQASFVGQLVSFVDGDGVLSTYSYDASFGYLEYVTANPGGGNATIVTHLVADRLGRATQETYNSTSSDPLVIANEYNSAHQLVSRSMVVGGVPHEERYYYDKYGNLAVRLRNNLDPSGQAPDDYGPSPRADIARPWLRDEWHYLGHHLLTQFEDRRPLDRDAAGAEYDDPLALYQRTDFIWRSDGVLSQVALPSGAVRTLTLDGYGTIYKSEVSDSGSGNVLIGKYLINDALDVVRIIDGLGNATVIERNNAGVVESVTQPATTALPSGYPFTAPGQLKIEYDTDALGRQTAVRLLEVGAASSIHEVAVYYDALGRAYREVRTDVASAATQERKWHYSGSSKIERADMPGGRFVTRSYDALARIDTAADCLDTGAQNGYSNEVEYSYQNNTPFLAVVLRKNVDEAVSATTVQNRRTEYVRDELGRPVTVKVGPELTSLDHHYAYYTSGATASYTDPVGKVEKFLPDALGRRCERFLPGSQPIYNGTLWLDYSGPGEQTERLLSDGLGHVTRMIYDFAGRPTVVLEPGSTNVPTLASPNHPHTKLYSYDAASRLVDYYTGDQIHLAFDRDAQGRLLQRRRVAPSSNALVSNLWGRDILKRNTLGQVVELSSKTAIGAGDEYIHETFQRDSFGRTTSELFEYGASIANQVEVLSHYVGGDPFRRELHLTNSVSVGNDKDLYLRYVPDPIGRVASIDWKTSPAQGSPWIPLAQYEHEGGAIRTRKTTQALGVAQGVTPFDFTTTYDYDDYGRMSRIEHSFAPTTAYYDFLYDDASNLVREGYAKQGGGVGDRFAYDEHHRLKDAWLGSDAQHFAAVDPNGSQGTFDKKLTYGLDAANNRDDVTVNGVTTDYTVEPDSNRYSQIGSASFVYDNRGNEYFNGTEYKVFDAVGRLSEVYRMVPTGTSSSATSSQQLSGSTTTFSLTDFSALEAARGQILQRIAPQAAVLLHLPNDPGVRADSREPLSPAVASATTTDSEGEEEVEDVVFELVAFYLYDPMNRRVTRWVRDDATYYYAYDGWEQVQKYGLGASTTFLQSTRGEEFDELIAYRSKIDSGAWNNRYIAEGGGHCPMRVLDESGLVIEVQEYDPYGRAVFVDAGGQQYPASQQGNPYGWRMMEPGTRSSGAYCRNRYYDARLGRFVSLDLLGVEFDPITWRNAYSYGSASPLVQADPLGLQLIFPAWAQHVIQQVAPDDSIVGKIADFDVGASKAVGEAVQSAVDTAVAAAVVTTPGLSNNIRLLPDAMQDSLVRVASGVNPEHPLQDPLEVLANDIAASVVEIATGDAEDVGHGSARIAIQIAGFLAGLRFAGRVPAPRSLTMPGMRAPKFVMPGIRVVTGQYVDDCGRIQPWRAHYDIHGRLLARTDYNAGNRPAGISDVHHHVYDISDKFPKGVEVQSHVPGEFPGAGQ